MGNTDNLDSWEQIRRGVVKVEALISQKQFNASMVEALQVLNLMLRGLAEKACIIDTDPMVIIDELYRDRWISKSTCEHYHKIRIIGMKALNEGNSNAYDASQAHQLLSQEVYTFANEFYKVKKKRPFLRSGSRTAARNTPAARNAIAARAAAAQQAALSRQPSPSESRDSGNVSAQGQSPVFRQDQGNRRFTDFRLNQEPRLNPYPGQAPDSRQFTDFRQAQEPQWEEDFPQEAEPESMPAGGDADWNPASGDASAPGEWIPEEHPDFSPEPEKASPGLSQDESRETEAESPETSPIPAKSPREQKMPFAVKGIFRGRVTRPAAAPPAAEPDSAEEGDFQEEASFQETPDFQEEPDFQDSPAPDAEPASAAENAGIRPEPFFSPEPEEELFPDEPNENSEDLFGGTDGEEEFFSDETEGEEEFFSQDTGEEGAFFSQDTGEEGEFFSDGDDGEEEFFSDDADDGDDFFSDDEEEDFFSDEESDDEDFFSDEEPDEDSFDDETEAAEGNSEVSAKGQPADSRNISAPQATGRYSAPLRRSASAQRKKSLQAEDLLKILVPVAVIILLLIIISRLRPEREPGLESSVPVQTEESVSGEYIPESSDADPSVPAETETAESETAETTTEETATEETTVPETTAPETTAPETTAPETAAPETTPPETTPPETTAPETTAPETMAPETAAPETTAPETAAPSVTYVTTTELYVRSQPSADSQVLGVLASRAPVEYVRAYNDTWAVIMYEGQEAYVSARYLTPQ